MTSQDISVAQRRLSPRRNTTEATDITSLVAEQLVHFSVDQNTPFGQHLASIATHLYESQDEVEALWQTTLSEMAVLPAGDRIARFNALKFLSFQLAKILDSVQSPFRRSYQALNLSGATQSAKGPYPIIDNVTALFSATPVIARTATYIYACAEWIEDAFIGKEPMLEIYSRLLNPTSISLANYIVDLEAGQHAGDYLAWNYSSGMAAIDATLSHLLGRDDILITSRNIYGGAHQLIHDWYAKPGNLAIAVETFDGYTADDFEECCLRTKETYRQRLAEGRRIYLYLESPCNPHGYVLDIPQICQAAHQHGIRVMLDATVGTPFLHRPLAVADHQQRPDFLIHSYTKDLAGTGSVIAGCVIGRNEDMFLPKGHEEGSLKWSDTMFWNVYYVKGAFLSADAAFEVIQGIRTLDVRMLRKCINTEILAKYLAAHPSITVYSSALPDNNNHSLTNQLSFLGLTAPLFTIDLGEIPRDCFRRFFDSLSPVFSHMISLGQSNTIVSCPSLTTHSELDHAALTDAGMTPTTIRFSVGDEDPCDLIHHLKSTVASTIDQHLPGFSNQLPDEAETADLIRRCYLAAHQRYIESRLADSIPPASAVE